MRFSGTMRTQDRDGNSTVEIVPNDFAALLSIEFEGFEYMEPVGPSGDSDLALTHFHPDGFERV